MRLALSLIMFLLLVGCGSTSSRPSSSQSMILVENPDYPAETEEEKRIASQVANQASLDCSAAAYGQLGVFQAPAVTNHQTINICDIENSPGAALGCGTLSAIADGRSRRHAQQAARNYKAAFDTIYRSCLNRKGWTITNKPPN